MSTQQNPTVYARCIQYQLANIVSPVSVYANFNRNYATQNKFITWQLRNIHQEVYTGQLQSNKGIDRPIFQISCFAQEMADCFNLSNSILQSLHGYSGIFGNPATDGFYISKADIMFHYNSYDNELGLHQIFMDCTLDVPT